MAVLGKAQSLRMSEEQCFARRAREKRPEGRHRRCAQSKTAPERGAGDESPRQASPVTYEVRWSREVYPRKTCK